MDIFIWLGYFVFGIMLYLGNLFLKKKYNISRANSIVFSLIYLMIIAGVCSSNNWSRFNDNLFIVIIFQFVVDIIFSTYFLEENFFEKSEDNILYYVILIASSFIINQSFFNQVSVVFPTGEDLRVILWLLVIIFLYKICSQCSIFKGRNFVKTKFKLDAEHILVSYVKLKHRFNNEVNFSNKQLELIVFAIMVFENDRCPIFFRKINNLLFKIDGKRRKLGIMQVESSKFISDVDSIELVYKKLEKISDNKNKGKVKKEEEIISKYSKEYSEEINYIYNVIKNF